MQDLTNTFPGERLIIRPFEPSDIDSFLRIRSDPGFRQFMLPANAPHPISRIAIQKRLEALTENGRSRHRWGPRLIMHKHSNQAIGTCGIIRTAGLPLPELSYCIISEYRGKGYCREAVALLLNSFHFEHFGAFCHHHNAVSLGILKKLGLSIKGEIHHPFLNAKGLWHE